MPTVGLKEFFPRGFCLREGHCAIRQHRLSDLVQLTGTPVFVYDACDIEARARELRQGFPGFGLYYSMKANPAPAIVRLFMQLGFGIEIASGGELRISLQCGVPSHLIRFAGPGKSIDEIRLALRHGIDAFHVESADELTRIETSASSCERKVGVSVRVNAPAVGSRSLEVMASGASPFGMDSEEVPAVISAIRASPALIFRGLHFYFASQILEGAEILANFGTLLDLTQRIGNQCGIEIQEAVFGAGLGVPCSLGESSVNVGRIGKSIRQLISESQLRSGTKYILETGRFLVARSGILLSTVLDVKKSRGRWFVVIDAGANSFARHIVARTQHIVLSLARVPRTELTDCSIVGPLCTPLDRIADVIVGEIPRVGEHVAILVAGAYGRSMALVDFLSHRAAGEILVDSRGVHILRPRGDFPGA